MAGKAGTGHGRGAVCRGGFPLQCPSIDAIWMPGEVQVGMGIGSREAVERHGDEWGSTGKAPGCMGRRGEAVCGMERHVHTVLVHGETCGGTGRQQKGALARGPIRRVCLVLSAQTDQRNSPF